MGYTTPGTSKLSLGVDTSAESLKSDVKKKIAKDSGKIGKLGVDMTFDHDKIKADAKSSGTDTRQNESMANTIANAGASKQKNVSRGHYTGDQTATTSGGSLKIGGNVTPVTTTETYGNITKPKGSIDKSGNKISSTGTGFIPQGKGSTVTSYKTDMPEESREFESRASTIGESSTRSRWSKGANNIFLQNPTLKSGHQGVQEQKNYGQISKREHSKLQAKNVLGADASKKQLRQKGRDIRKTGRATDRRNKSDERLREKEIAGDARLGLDLSSASKRDYSKTDSARKKVNDLSLLSQNKINKNIV